MCLATIGASVASSWDRSGAYGCLKRKTTVRSSGVSIAASTLPIDALVRAWNLSRTSSKLNLTSAEVKGVPSCHVTPGWSRTRYTAPPCSTCQLSASSGSGLPRSSRPRSPFIEQFSSGVGGPARSDRRIQMAGIGGNGDDQSPALDRGILAGRGCRGQADAAEHQHHKEQMTDAHGLPFGWYAGSLRRPVSAA